MRPAHHPSDGLLVSYGAGGLDEGLSLAVATHLALCPACREAVGEAEAVGGALLEALPPATLCERMRLGILERLDETPVEQTVRPPSRAGGETADAPPEPLASLLSASGTARRWRWLAPGISQLPLPLEGRTQGRLLRVSPGRRIPDHRHEGLELTLVLGGAFLDGTTSFGRGDIAEADESVVHRLRADSRMGCVCLAVTEGPLRLLGPLGRLFGPIF